jgi:hypothetical protein
VHSQVSVAGSQNGAAPAQGGLQVAAWQAPFTHLWPVPQEISVQRHVFVATSQAGVVPAHAGTQESGSAQAPVEALHTFPTAPQDAGVHRQVSVARSQ